MNVFGGIGASMFKPAATIQQMATGSTSPGLQELATPPAGTAGAVGNLAGQIGQFMIPGPAEAKAAQGIREMLPMVPGAVREAAAMTPQIASAAAINKLQGGSATTGAIAGAAGAGLGKIAEAAAPGTAESALGAGMRAKGFGKTVGKAALEETAGYTAPAVAASANAKVQFLSDHLSSLYSASTEPVSINPAMKVLDDALDVARRRGNKAAVDHILGLRDMLTRDPLTGMPVQRTTPAELLELKRGIGDITGWNPAIQPKEAQALNRKLYHAIDEELDRAVPEGANLNQRISSTIEVRNAANRKALEAGVAQRSFHRIAAHTGGMVLPGIIGYREGGWEGALTGAALGTIGMEAVSSPGFKMWLARQSPDTIRAIVKASLPAGRALTETPNGR